MPEMDTETQKKTLTQKHAKSKVATYMLMGKMMNH